MPKHSIALWGRRNSGRPVHPVALACAAGLAALALSLSKATASEDPAEGAAAAPAPSKTIGLVLTGWRYALVETPHAEECSLGLQKGEVDQYKAMDDFQKHMETIGGGFQIRGPNGETAGFNPMSVNDPLPFSELTTKVGYGINLDGTKDGHATEKTCAHEKFTSPDGEKVDNQIARVVGCVQGYRTGGMMSDYYNNEIATFSVNRHLIEVTGVDDETNDPSVDVTIYKGKDRLVRTGDGFNFVPFQSQRIDTDFPQLILKTTGKIVDGVLITDPIPEALLPRSQERQIGYRVMKDLTLRLKLTPTGAEGILAGYENLDSWWNPHSKLVVSEVGKFSSAGIYRALHRYADGYPDPETGECTYISSAHKVTAVRANIVHADDKETETTLLQE